MKRRRVKSSLVWFPLVDEFVIMYEREEGLVELEVREGVFTIWNDNMWLFSGVVIGGPRRNLIVKVDEPRL